MGKCRGRVKRKTHTDRGDEKVSERRLVSLFCCFKKFPFPGMGQAATLVFFRCPISDINSRKESEREKQTHTETETENHVMRRERETHRETSTVPCGKRKRKKTVFRPFSSMLLVLTKAEGGPERLHQVLGCHCRQVPSAASSERGRRRRKRRKRQKEKRDREEG